MWVQLTSARLLRKVLEWDFPHPTAPTQQWCGKYWEVIHMFTVHIVQVNTTATSLVYHCSIVDCYTPHPECVKPKGQRACIIIEIQPKNKTILIPGGKNARWIHLIFVFVFGTISFSPVCGDLPEKPALTYGSGVNFICQFVTNKFKFWKKKN